MKILFIMPNPHYVRNFDSVIGALAERGHRVVLGFECGLDGSTPEVQRSVGALLQTHGGAIDIMLLPDRTSFWSGAAAQLRALRDYSRYFLPLHQRARRCADRAASFLIEPLRVLDNTKDPWRERAARLIGAFCAYAEEIVPVEANARAAIEACSPDIVLLTPLIDLNSDQVDYLKVCRALRIPVGHGVASWDNLTNKGLIKGRPDRIFVWNEAQKREAVELHAMPPDRVAVTGAQLFDRWFEWRPSRNRETFCSEIGLDPAKPILLYTASSVFICRSEIEFTIRWLKSVRASKDPRLSEAGVIVRPHPKAVKTLSQWDSKDLQALGGVVVYPRSGHMPLGDEARNDYYDSLHHAAAVIGINTTAMVEAAIVGRRSFTILIDEVREGQDGMVHFQHLRKEGFLGVAESLDEHVMQLADEIGRSETNDSAKRFVLTFLRPYGLDQAATPRFVAEVEKLEGEAVEGPSLVARSGFVQRPLLLPFVALAARYDKDAIRRRYEQRNQRGKALSGFLHRAAKSLRRIAERSRRRIRRMLPIGLMRRALGRSMPKPAEASDMPVETMNAANATGASTKSRKRCTRAAA